MQLKEEVQAFLEQIKAKMKVFEIIYRPRDKNLNCLINLELNPFERDNYINALTFEHYIGGPEITDGTKLPYYEFCMKIKNTLVYIKLNKGNDRKPVDCISFHESTNPNPKFPLK